MKVLQINSHYNVGGAGKIVAYLHHELQKSGTDSVVIYGRGSDVKEKSVYKIGNGLTNYFDVLITRVIGSAGFQSWSATRHAIDIINKEKPDILHLHGLHGYYLNYSLLFNYINKKRIPCVWTFHDCLAFTAKCGYTYECTKYIKGCNHCSLLKDYPATFGFDLTKNLWRKKKQLFTKTDNKIIVSPSEWMTNLAKTSFFGKYECITINNGIDTDITFKYRDQKECREELGFKTNSKIALGVAFGQENPRKGVRYIIQAAQKLPNITFILIGWDNKTGSDISYLNNVVVKKFTNNQEELAKYYAAADVFLLPSLAENYATTAIEALASGTPVVGFNVGGIPEQAFGEFGITVEAGDQAAFNAAIVHQIEHSDKENRMNIAKLIAKRNSMNRMKTEYFKIYDKLMFRG